MTINNRDDYIRYRFHRAEESFEEATTKPLISDVKRFVDEIGKHI